MFAEVNKETVVTYPYDYDILCKKNPYTKFPSEELLVLYANTEANISGNQLVRVVVADMPQYDEATQIAIQNDKPSLNNNVWTLGWTVQNLSQAEKNERLTAKSKLVREQRNEKLNSSDWTQLPDSNADKQAWGVYRQALRDIPGQSGFPWNVQWPIKPE